MRGSVSCNDSLGRGRSGASDKRLQNGTTSGRLEQGTHTDRQLLFKVLDALVEDRIDMTDVKRQLRALSGDHHGWSVERVRPSDLVEDVRVPIRNLRNHDACTPQVIDYLVEDVAGMLDLIGTSADHSEVGQAA